MLLKWKCILTNWINCYCNERDSKDLDINFDALLIIISQLRRNLSLDDSRSSLLEAHNIQEFILEKYPDFKFENGTCDPSSEEDLHLSASLLLFFVCVNSKNIDLKNAMCSKLSSSDQEIIMKFSKCLMGCSNITSSDVLQAITEACGQDIAGAETVTTNTVAETPPALRSLHSEVRRLQAALDAERFDRNYLQEELSRTNLKLEKLTKVKEQYKQEIVNLKARVSDSCSEDNSTAGRETSHNNSVKLAKQLEQAEERLAHLQEELSNVEYERNGYKNKLDEVKRDRDKYFALSQQENIRASQLAEELDSERRQCNSLRELVTELRQHNHLNRMDSSQLECDDLDTSVHSLQHNSSVCSEVCASIIEVQLAEERSKIATLKNQMQMLQDQLIELNNKYEKEKNDLGKALSEKECDIMNLKHRINEEIESKNVIKSKCDNDITKLNNEINELEQTLKDTTEHARKTIDTKMQEIQTLQEEKLSLLQSFSNETSKLESKVQELKKELESEKTSKQKMREDYDNHIMKLNEKVLNRNNELVEFQNKIVTKGEEIESLQIQLRNEKDMRQELINKHNNDVLHYNNVIKEQNLNIQKSSEEIAELRKQVQQYYECIEEMNKERNNLNASLLGLKEEVKILTSEKQIWLKEKEKLANEFDENNETIHSLKSQLQTEIQFKNEIQSKLREVESYKQILLEEKTTLTNKLSSVIAENSNACEKLKEEIKDLTSEKQILLKEKEKLKNGFDEKIVIISSLESQLQTEIQIRNEIRSKFCEVESDKEILTEEKFSLTNKLSEIISKNAATCQMLEEKVKNLTSQKQIVLTEKEQLQNEFDEKNEIINSLESQLQTEVNFKNEIQSQLLEVETNKEILCKEKTSLTNKLSTVIAENSNTCEMLKEEIKNLTSEKQILLIEKEQLHNEFGKKNEVIQSLESQLQTEIQFRNEIQSKLCQLESEKDLLHKELTSLTNEMSTVIAQNSDACEKLNLEVKNLTSEKQMLLREKEQLQNEKEKMCEETTSLKIEVKNLASGKEMLLKEKEILKNKFAENNNIIKSLESQLQTEINLRDEIQSKLSEFESEKEILFEGKTSLEMEVKNLTSEKEMLLKEKETLQNKFDENNNTIYSLQNQLQTEILLRHDIQSKLSEVESEREILCEEKTSLKIEVYNLTNEKEMLLKEKETLQNKLDENNNTIYSLESQLQTEIQLKDEIQSKLSEVKSEKEILCEEKTSLKMEVKNLTSEIEMLLKEKETLQNKFEENTNTITSLKSQLQTEIQIRNEMQSKLYEVESDQEILTEEKISLTNKLSKIISENSATCQMLEEKVKNLTSEKQIVLKEKEQLQNEFLEKNEIINSLQSQLQTEVKIKNEIQSKLREVETEKEILCEEKTDNSNARAMLQEELKKLNSEKQILLKEKEQLRNEFDKRNEIINSLESQLQTEIQLRNEIQSKLRAVESDKEILCEEKTSLTNKLSTVIADNSNMCETLKEEIEKLTNEKEMWFKETEVLQNKFDEQNEIITSLESQLQNETKLRNEVQSKLCEVDSENTALDNKMSTVIAENSDACELLKEEVKNLTTEKEMLIKEKEILQNKFDEKNETINSLENQLQNEIQLRNEIQIKLCEVESEKERLCEENTYVTNKLSTVIAENSEACEKLNQRILQEQQASQYLQNQVDNSNKKIEELLEIVKQKNDEFSKQIEEYKGIIEAKTNEVESLVFKNATLHNELNEVKIQLDSKVHSLKDKLIDNENITDKLKATYESQIDNLNVMVSKLTSYLKEKTIEIEATNKEKAQLEEALNKSNEAISVLEDEVKCQKQKHDKLIREFESERVVLKNIVSVTEDVMEDHKLNFNNKITEVTKQNEELKNHIKNLEDQMITERKNAEITLNDKVDILNIALKDLSDTKDVKRSLEEENLTLKELVLKKTEEIELATSEKNSLEKILESVKNDKTLLENKMEEFELLKDNQITDNMNLLKEKENEIKNLKEELERQTEAIKQFETLQETLSKERDEIFEQLNEKDTLLETEKNLRISQLDEIQKLQQLQAENHTLHNLIKEKESEIMAIKEHFENEIGQNQQVSDRNKIEQTKLLDKCQILEEYQIKAEEELKHRQAKIEVLVSEMETIRHEFAQVEVEKNILIEKLETELTETKKNYLRYKQEAEKYSIEIGRLRENLNAVNTNTVYNLKKENELLLKAVTNNENMASNDKENIPNYREDVAIKIRDLQHQVHDSAFDNTTSSIDSSKTITDLEKIIQDKNRTITTLHSDITYLKTLIAESENKLLDVTKDLDLSRENCHQLSNQLKKVVLQKNEEISELRNKITKMSATETRASQIIKVSAKYQAMIIKRIAEIKNNTVLKELTNFGNSANTNGENELRRSFNAGNITMEDLENFLETTDRHLKRCSEKQIALQKERDRLLEINKINDSEIIAMRKFLTELSVSVKTFNSVKDLYSQKLNKVIALQRTVRREILNLDGRINDATMCKLERGYAAIMQDLSECALNLERWVDRSIVRSISPEKIKQAFMSELDRASLVPTNFQNTSLEIQFGELESSFHKLLKEVMQAQSGDGAKDAQALTIMEVRAEYEDKLSRMKTKMKELYVDQISQFQEKHKKVIEEYERKLEKANEETKELSKAYQQHIRSLTTELWNVGEKFIIQKDEAQWLRKQQKSGSLMSLQHVHSTGLVAPHEDAGRPSDTLSLRSLQVHNKNERKGRKTCGDMSDEEGEVFDNRCLRELTETPRRGRPSAVGGAGGGANKRLSELQRRNTLCQPHLKSSYPAETQFVPGVQEDDIKCNGSMSLGGKAQRKEVGITAYKKPGPPTPSKQAGRLSATDSELRESLRVEAEPGARRTATPSRLFGLFRGKQDTIEGTPRGRRLSNIFRKK